MERLRKCIAEFIGTFILVTLGCGTAMLVGCSSDMGGGYILTALAFGLAIVAMAYSLGNISGGHVNPAVSLAVLMNGGIGVIDFLGYFVSQILGAFAGSALLAMIFDQGKVVDKTGGYGTNGLAGVHDSAVTGLIVEVVLTCIFVLAILGVTSKKQGHGSFGGLIIGLTLTGVHILGIGLTGTSVNPARSLGPAMIAAIKGDATAINCVWVFIVGPFIGAALAAIIYRILEGAPDEVVEDDIEI